MKWLGTLVTRRTPGGPVTFVISRDDDLWWVDDELLPDHLRAAVFPGDPAQGHIVLGHLFTSGEDPDQE